MASELTPVDVDNFVCVEGEAEETDDEESTVDVPSTEVCVAGEANEADLEQHNAEQLEKAYEEEQQIPKWKLESFAHWKFKDVNTLFQSQVAQKHDQCYSTVKSRMHKVSQMLDNTQNSAMLTSRNIREGMNRLSSSSKFVQNIFSDSQNHLPKIVFKE